MIVHLATQVLIFTTVYWIPESLVEVSENGRQLLGCDLHHFVCHFFMDSAAPLEVADNDGNASNASGRALKTSSWLEYLENLLIMPKKYEPIRNSPSATESRIQTLKTSKRFQCFYQQLVPQIYEENDLVMGYNKMGETTLKIGFPRLNCLQSITEIKLVAGG